MMREAARARVQEVEALPPRSTSRCFPGRCERSGPRSRRSGPEIAGGESRGRRGRNANQGLLSRYSSYLKQERAAVLHALALVTH